MAKKIILSSAYYPSIQYISEIANADVVYIEKHENYSRQTFRNRCSILSCNGILDLSIPIKKSESLKQSITEVKIDYSTNWQHIHIQGIISAYRKSPFFAYYSDEIFEAITNNHAYLFDLNNDILKRLLKIITIKKDLHFSDVFTRNYTDEITDLRDAFHPKIKASNITFNAKPYIQTFSDRFAFIANLSILDLIFNTGPDSKSYLL